MNVASSEQERTSWRARLAVFILLALYAAQGVVAGRDKNVTVDEIFYVAAGYYHWKTGDFYFNATNPPLPKMLGAAALLPLDPKLPPRAAPPRNWSIIEQWHYAREFLYGNRVEADRLLLAARLPIIALGVVLGIYVYCWSKALFGTPAGVLAVGLFAMSPNLIAHGSLVTQDLALAAFMFIAAYYFWRYWRNPRLLPLVLCVLFAGFAALSKSAAIFLAPVLVLYVLVEIARGGPGGVHALWPWVRRLDERRRRTRQLLTAVTAGAVIALVGLFVLHAGYGFSEVAARDPEAAALTAKLPMPRPAAQFITWVFPGPFVEMIHGQGKLVKEAGPTYFASALHPGGLWYQMAASVAIKTPVGTLLLAAAGLVAVAIRRDRPGGALLPVLLIVVTLGAFSVLSRINMGIRYVLPIYPAMFVLSGAVLGGRWATSRFGHALAGLGCGATAVSVALVTPHYLSYFNELVGGPRSGYRWLTDANLDWGQDLKNLRAWMEKKGVERVALGYFGSADPDYYGLNFDWLPSVGVAPREPEQKWWYEEGAGCSEPLEFSPGSVVAVGATLLASPGWMTEAFGPCYAALRQREPDDMVGYSILIYRIEDAAAVTKEDPS